MGRTAYAEPQCLYKGALDCIDLVTSTKAKFIQSEFRLYSSTTLSWYGLYFNVYNFKQYLVGRIIDLY